MHMAQSFRLMIPNTFMNLSGQAVGPLANFYRIAAAEILVAYDEMAFDPGVVKLKQGGGANGHNGIKDIIASLGIQRTSTGCASASGTRATKAVSPVI